MKICKKGFSLFYFVIYLAIFAIIVSLTMQWSTKILCLIKKAEKNCSTKISGYMIHDLLLRDIRFAPKDKKEWYSIAKTQLIWQKNVESIGWYKEEDKIIRITGNYDMHTASWSNAQKNTVACGVDELFFIVNSNTDTISTVTFIVVLKQYVITNTITLRKLNMYEPI